MQNFFSSSKPICCVRYPLMTPFSSGTPLVGPQSMSIHSARKCMALSAVRLFRGPYLAHPKYTSNPLSTSFLACASTSSLVSKNFWSAYFPSPSTEYRPSAGSTVSRRSKLDISFLLGTATQGAEAPVRARIYFFALRRGSKRSIRSQWARLGEVVPQNQL